MVNQNKPGNEPEPGGHPFGPVDINEASWEELRAVDGIGESRASDIVAWREKHGPFRTVDDLQHVPSIAPKDLPDLRPRLKT